MVDRTKVTTNVTVNKTYEVDVVINVVGWYGATVSLTEEEYEEYERGEYGKLYDKCGFEPELLADWELELTDEHSVTEKIEVLRNVD